MRAFPCAGLVEAWAEGVGWQAVTDDCNLDGGDIARLLSRTTDLLRQVMAAVCACFCSALEAGTSAFSLWCTCLLGASLLLMLQTARGNRRLRCMPRHCARLFNLDSTRSCCALPRCRRCTCRNYSRSCGLPRGRRSVPWTGRRSRTCCARAALCLPPDLAFPDGPAALQERCPPAETVFRAGGQVVSRSSMAVRVRKVAAHRTSCRFGLSRTRVQAQSSCFEKPVAACPFTCSQQRRFDTNDQGLQVCRAARMSGLQEC